MTVPWHRMSALALGAEIGAGAIDPLDLCEHFLARVEDTGSDRSVYLKVLAKRARAEATAARSRARAGLRRGPLDGIPISWKDLFDTAGDTTTAASPALTFRPPAAADAAVVARARRAGLVCLGKTNLTELAFSGLGINPASGTPRNPFDDKVARAPGGSSSGAAVSVARGLAAAAVGTDTGGSVRIPAAWNGLVGLKTTAGRLPTSGLLPLAPSLDSVGTLSHDVADANALYAVLAAEEAADLAGASARGTRLGVARGVFWLDLEPGLRKVVRAAIECLAEQGAEVEWHQFDAVAEAYDLIANIGPFVALEGYAVWGEFIEAEAKKIYRHVRERFRAAQNISSFDAGRLRLGLAAAAKHLAAEMAGYDAVLAPTVALSPPPLAPLVEHDHVYVGANLKALRNATLGNVLGICALTLPCGADDNGLPVGLMLMARPNHERALLRIARAVEIALANADLPAD